MTRPLKQAMAITLRDAGPDDEPFLLQVFSSTRAAELAQVPWPDEQKEAFLRMQFQAQHAHYHERYPDGDYKVVLRDGAPAGRIYIARAPGLIKILDVAILPEFRQGGIGSSLIQDVLDEGAESSCKVQIYVETFNPSFALFQRMGFAVLEEDGFNYLLEWPAAASATQ